MIKMFLLSLYLLYIVNTSKTSHVSKMLYFVGICVNNIYIFEAILNESLDVCNRSQPRELHKI